MQDFDSNFYADAMRHSLEYKLITSIIDRLFSGANWLVGHNRPSVSVSSTS